MPPTNLPANPPIVIPPTPKYYGWIPSPPDFRDRKYVPKKEILEQALPPSIDLASKAPDGFKPVYQQGTLGSCGPQTVAGDLIFAQLAQEKRPEAIQPSRLFIYYCTRALMGTINQDSGVQNRSMMKALAKYGWPDEKLHPYADDNLTFRKKPSQEAFDQAAKRRIVEYLAVSQELDTMKACLASGDTFVFGFTVYNSINEADSSGIIPFPQAGNVVQGGHDVLIVGYNDETSLFKFRNSWGPGWGQSGYGFIPYSYATHPQLAGDFWTLTKSYLPDPPPPLPVPEPEDLAFGPFHFRQVTIDGHEGIFVY